MRRVSNLKRAAFVTFVALGLTLLAAPKADARPATMFELLTGFAAKEGCSCAFVVEQSDEYCRDFAQPGIAPVEVVIDHAGKTVTAKFLATSRTSRFTEGAGCLNDALP